MTDDSLPCGDDGEVLPDEMLGLWIAMLAGDESRAIRGARIVRIEDDAAWFDIGSKFESPIPLAAWANESPPQVGELYDVTIVEGCVVDDRPLKIARARIERLPGFGSGKPLADRFASGQLCRGSITRRITNGFLVDIGVNAFLPEDSSTAAVSNDPAAMIDQPVTCRIVAIDETRRIIRLTLA